MTISELQLIQDTIDDMPQADQQLIDRYADAFRLMIKNNRGAAYALSLVFAEMEATVRKANK